VLRPGRAAALVLSQRGHLFPWVPVAFGTGIGLWFALPAEPAAAALLAVAAAGLLAGLGAARAGAVLGPLIWLPALIAAGLCAAAWRTASVAGPVLSFRYYGPVEGRVVEIDRSASDAVRLTLDRVQLDRVPPRRTPHRVRISLHGPQDWFDPRPGVTIQTTGHLSPPGGPVEPGGFDFRRHAWFEGLGAVGYTRNPVVERAPPEPGAQRIFTWRMALSDRVRAALPGETGAFAAAVMTGDRASLSRASVEALRHSNLAHLLAISGLHMGLLAGFVFWALRALLALAPSVAMRVPGRKLAAAGALVVAAGYLALSGGNVATERAFVMVGVALGAVMVDRRALSLRAVALAAMIVLALRPEALTGPGFQMSFAATVALVAVFAGLRGERRRRWWTPVLTLLISSAVAGAATAPFAAAHFNMFARLGLVANLVAVPVMGTLVMPAAVVAALLMPLGLEQPALWVMGLGLDWILMVARAVSGVEGAVAHVPAPPGAVLPLVAAGGLVIVLWQGAGRWTGAAVLVLAAGLWWRAERPAVLIAADGGLVGVMTAEGRALSRDRGGGFTARIWLENDGDPATQEEAFARWRLVEGVAHVTGRVRASEVPDCGAARLIVSNADLPDLTGCMTLDRPMLEATGAMALSALPSSRPGGGLPGRDTGWGDDATPGGGARDAADLSGPTMVGADAAARGRPWGVPPRGGPPSPPPAAAPLVAALRGLRVRAGDLR